MYIEIVDFKMVFQMKLEALSEARNSFFNHCTPNKIRKPLRCKGLLSVKENEKKNILSLKGNNNRTFKYTEDDD